MPNLPVHLAHPNLLDLPVQLTRPTYRSVWPTPTRFTYRSNSPAQPTGPLGSIFAQVNCLHLPVHLLNLPVQAESRPLLFPFAANLPVHSLFTLVYLGGFFHKRLTYRSTRLCKVLCRFESACLTYRSI